MENEIKDERKKYKIILIVGIILGIILIGVGTYFWFFDKNVDSNNKNSDTSEKNEVKSTITPLLYEVTKEGSSNKMYLFGSIHLANKSDLVFPKYVMDAYNNSHYLACEFDGVAYAKNQEKVMADAMKMLYQDGTTIKDHLSEKTYNKLVDFLTKKNAYINVYEQYKLYFFVSLLSNLMAQDAKINATGGVDDYFEQKAYDDKKTVLEVESYDYQMNLFEEFPDELYDLMLSEEIDNYEESVAGLQGLYNAWKSGNADDLLKYNDEDIEIQDTYTEQQKKYVESFNKKLIDERNNSMLQKAIGYFNNNQDVFFMVGALHIVGDTGLAKQLEQRGFIVKQVS